MQTSLTTFSRVARVLFSGALVLGAACAPDGDAELEGFVEQASETPASELDGITQALVLSGSATSGQALPVTPGEGFKYFEIAGAKCRDGSNAGVSVKRAATPSNKVLVYLQGGGACFNTQTCLTQVNPNSILEQRRSPAPRGIFDDGNASNPFADYNKVFVPYCTGDFHMGNKVSSVPLGPQNQLFVGRKNLGLILPSVVATFPGAQRVVLTGSSAGGAGATVSAMPVKNAFGASNPEFYLIDDAGPLLSAGNTFFNDYLPVAEQTKWKNLWGLEQTIVAECGGRCNVGNFIPEYAKHVIQIIGRKPALVVGKQDVTVAIQYGNARVDQYPLIGLVGVELRNALDDYRSRMGNTWSTYYVTTPDSLAKQHMFLLGDNFYSVAQQVVGSSAQRSLVSWVSDYVNGASVPNVGP